MLLFTGWWIKKMMRREDMYFTSQSAKSIVLILIVFITFISLIYVANGVTTCTITDAIGTTTNYNFCDKSYYVDNGVEGNCGEVCKSENIIYCKPSLDPSSFYDNKCYADFDFVANYNLIIGSELNQFINTLYGLVGEGKGNLLLGNTNFDNALTVTDEATTASLLTMMDLNSLNLLSTITPAFAVAEKAGVIVLNKFREFKSIIVSNDAVVASSVTVNALSKFVLPKRRLPLP